MNFKNAFPLALLTCALAGCVTASYPVAYQVPLNPPQVTSAYGPADLSVNAVQDVPAHHGAQLYFQVVSPTDVAAYVFDKTSSAPGGQLLGQFRGTSFYSSAVPTGDTVEFVFSATQPVTGGSLQLSVSDSPMTSGSSVVPYTSPVATSQAVGTAAQPDVSIDPASLSIAAGQSVTFTVSGGAGSGTYVWGGAAPASGISNTYTFNVPGTYNVTVYNTGDATYAQSNTAAATIVVSSASTAQPSTSTGNGITVTPVR
jgi:plastocyanin